MNRDDVIMMAREAGIRVVPSAINGEPYIDDRAFFEGRIGNLAGDGFSRPSVFAAIERFASLVAAHEREECAKVCKEIADSGKLAWHEVTAHACARAIRQRGSAD